GALMDRISLRAIMAVGVARLIIGFVALSFVTPFTQVLLVHGLLMAPANIPAGPLGPAVLLTRRFSKPRRAAPGRATSGLALGAAVVPPVIQALLDSFPWREAYRVLALILACCTIPALALIVNRPADRGLFPDGADAAPDTKQAATDRLSTREVIGDPAFWMI